MLSIYGVIMYLIRKQKYTILYYFLRKVLGPRLLHPCYSRPALHTRLVEWYKNRGRDYFLESWELV
jgi:hypothetical protein